VGRQLPGRRDFLRTTGTMVGVGLVCSRSPLSLGAALGLESFGASSSQSDSNRPDYVLRIAASPVEIAPKHIVSTITYNGRFPGPLLRFKEGQPATVEVHNDTDTPEQLHWHGQMVSTDVDGAAEEGTPFIPAQGMRRIVFTPRPSGFRFYHTHNRAGADLHAGQYSGQVGPVYIEPKRQAGSYEVFLVLKEFEPSFSQGGDMAQDFLAPSTRVKELESNGESAMKASRLVGSMRCWPRILTMWH
jgi:FtsP/CotA-like multicopper oxidase with cupredoxin domain